MQNYILIGSNNGIACEILAVTDDTALLHNTAMTAKLQFDIITSFSHYPRLDGPAPAVGLKFNRPADAPLKRDLNQSWYSQEQLRLDV
jgi:hypothetical protein